MIVVANSEGDVDDVAGEQWRLLQSFGHVPAEGVENRVQFLGSCQFSVLSSKLETLSFGFFSSAYGCAVGMAAQRGENGNYREFFLSRIGFGSGRFRRELVSSLVSSFQVQLDVFVFQNLRRGDKANASR